MPFGNSSLCVFAFFSRAQKTPRGCHFEKKINDLIGSQCRFHKYRNLIGANPKQCDPRGAYILKINDVFDWL